jgi:2,4-dienoyl-CoA reductase-like NADH-dependent reductase (Old Yellow Enzyme family)
MIEIYQGPRSKSSVEIHLGHNYFASTFLSPRLNRRTDAYGGTLARTARTAPSTR